MEVSILYSANNIYTTLNVFPTINNKQIKIPATKPKFAQPILSHFFQAQSSLSTLTSPDCDPGSQSPESPNECITLSQQESAEQQQITPQPPVQVGQDFNPYLVDKENTVMAIRSLIKLGLPKFPGYVTIQFGFGLVLCLCLGFKC